VFKKTHTTAYLCMLSWQYLSDLWAQLQPVAPTPLFLYWSCVLVPLVWPADFGQMHIYPKVPFQAHRNKTSSALCTDADSPWLEVSPSMLRFQTCFQETLFLEMKSLPLGTLRGAIRYFKRKILSILIKNDRYRHWFEEGHWKFWFFPPFLSPR